MARICGTTHILDAVGPREIYTLPDATVTERHYYVEVAKRVPEAVLCMLSALAFHELTTQSPAAVWIALGKGARKPAILSPSLRVVRLTEPSLSEGVEKHTVEGVPARVYSAAKIVADCFKFRNKIGLDIAIEAVKDCLRQKKATSTTSTNLAVKSRRMRSGVPLLFGRDTFPTS